ncbi:MAG: hypothetical protein L0J18_12340, partial [Tetragenococcus koreensis]|nr:hypothetical protein [Tetragenococcus koreensis]MDN6166931.1 hypothetical protein [Tetragenococcus koreensis]MDN6541929.1 hypothetical protein [Tetragenococcus koreensis]MDN6701829.1 hypothetical protein [Tetragenococcus koreensis]
GLQENHSCLPTLEIIEPKKLVWATRKSFLSTNTRNYRAKTLSPCSYEWGFFVLKLFSSCVYLIEIVSFWKT